MHPDHRLDLDGWSMWLAEMPVLIDHGDGTLTDGPAMTQCVMVYREMRGLKTFEVTTRGPGSCFKVSAN